MSRTVGNFLLCVVVAGGLAACSSDESAAGSGVSRAQVVETYAANLAAGYADSVADELAFQADVGAFLADPSEDNLGAVRSSWLSSRAHYMLTEGARFYGGPIDGEIDGAPNYEGRLNSWPLDEAFIDYTAQDDTAGIVNKPELLEDITAEGLDELNATMGDKDISSGYHAVEFLLWGQALAPVGPGERPASDYSLDGPRANVERRATYLKVAVEGIVANLSAVRDAWEPGASYRSSFEKGSNESLTNMLTGLAKFSKGELGSQRIGAAYTSKDRRDQHDCFSSETLVDYERDARGIQAMYLGVYGDNDGAGLDDLVKAADPALDADLKMKLQTTIDAIVAIPKPFEDAIAGDDESVGRQAIQKALDALNAQGDTFSLAARAIGLTITVDDPAL
ncbi:MAG: imelysin family protein [Polyangiaceae bacterium]